MDALIMDGSTSHSAPSPPCSACSIPSASPGA
jgi:hypothetical protein